MSNRDALSRIEKQLDVALVQLHLLDADARGDLAMSVAFAIRRVADARETLADARADLPLATMQSLRRRLQEARA